MKVKQLQVICVENTVGDKSYFDMDGNELFSSNPNYNYYCEEAVWLSIESHHSTWSQPEITAYQYDPGEVVGSYTRGPIKLVKNQ